MVRSLKYYISQFIGSYIFIAVIAIVLGVLFSEQLIPFEYLGTFFLQIIFFLSSLKIDFERVIKSVQSIYSLLVVNVFMLIVLPIGVYMITSFIVPELAIAFLLLAAMPAGLTTPLLTDVIKGNVEFSLVLTVSTALLAPFTIPFVLELLVGAEIDLNVWDMFLKLVNIFVLPFIAAMLVRRFFYKQVQKILPTIKPLSLLLLGGLIMVLVAPQAEYIIVGLDKAFYLLIVMILFYIFLHGAGYFLTPWLSKNDRITVAVSVTYMNFVTSLYLASLYFPDPAIILVLVIQIIPWALMLLPFKYIITKFN